MDSTALKNSEILFEPEIYVQKDSSSEVDGIEILVEMAKNGKIDPWNIDIADVTDKYLQQLVEIKTNNLKLTGRTLFFAAVLLRLKSDILEGASLIEDEFPQDEFFDDFDMDMEDGSASINYSNVISIDQVLERRTSVKLHRERIVTLEELINQLKFYEKIDQKLAIKNKNDRVLRRAKSYEKFTPEDIINMAHDEYIETSIKTLQSALEKIFQTDSKVGINELRETGMDKVSIYIALLFLSASSNIDLVQDEFYSDIYVVPEAV